MPCFAGLDLDDLEQELFVMAWSSFEKFDPKKSKPTTFIEHIILKRQANLIEHYLCLKRGGRTHFCSLDEPNKDGICLSQTLADPKEIVKDLHARVDVARLLQTLPPRLRGLCTDLMEDNVSEIARKNKTSRSSIYRDLQKIKEAFQALS